jgi:hypothetical protein
MITITAELRKDVAEVICDNIDISFFKWGSLAPDDYQTLMKTADAAIMVVVAALAARNEK